jgi:tetratricopeptide (TPR) repeat protein
MALLNLGFIRQSEGRGEEAEKLYQRCMELLEKQPSSDLVLATLLENLAELEHERHKGDLSESYFRRALSVRERVFGPASPPVLDTLENYEALLRETGRTADADRLHARAQTIRSAGH